MRPARVISRATRSTSASCASRTARLRRSVSASMRDAGVGDAQRLVAERTAHALQQAGGEQLDLDRVRHGQPAER